MGTVVSFAVPDLTDAALFRTGAALVFARLRHADAVFSPFRPESPVSLIREGLLSPDDLAGHPDGPRIREVLGLCAELKRDSGGAFDAWAVGDPPGFDPCGAVKGWATEQASRAAAEHGLTRHALNAGGDVRLRGSGPAPWRVGLADPHHPGGVLAVLEVAEGAVATSGIAERGTHVFDPLSGRRAMALDQVTVTGPDLSLADGYATAALAMAEGPRGIEGTHAWLSQLADGSGYQAITVDPRGRRWMTDGMSALLRPHATSALAAQERQG